MLRRWVLKRILGATAICLNLPTVDAYASHSSSITLSSGQVWSIRSERLTSAKVVIGIIELWKDTVAVHVSIIDIPVPQGINSGNKQISIDHVPFRKSALEFSVDKLLAANVAPVGDFRSAYESWKKDKNASVFDLSVSKVITLMLDAIYRKPA